MKKYLRQFGGELTPGLKERYSSSPRWNGKAFENPVRTKIEFTLTDIPKLLHERFLSNVKREPKNRLACEPFDLRAFQSPSERAKVIWYGHSSILMRIDGRTIFIDPMMGANASPIAPFKTKRFTGSLHEILKEIPKVDIILLSHDHYDHLDLDSMNILIPKTDRFITSLGVGRHLEAWGCESARIEELDWWDEVTMGSLNITFTPSRHSSGRAVRDQSCTLWGGWVIDSGTEKIYFTGDGGYGGHFKEVGERLGPFDIGFVECGQYNEKWRVIHLHPEESVQAAIDSKIAKSIPVHWGGFALAMHDWHEPPRRFIDYAEEEDLLYTLPRIGEMFGLDHHDNNRWWEK